MKLLNDKDFSVTDYDGSYTVSVSGKYTCLCGCKENQIAGGICAHAVAVAEKEGTLQNYLDAVHTKKIADNSIQACQPARAGFKIHEKKRRRGANGIARQPLKCLLQIRHNDSEDSTYAALKDNDLDMQKPALYTSYWHNDEPFVICHHHDKYCVNAKVCVTCNITFSKRNPVKFSGEIIIVHKERYMRPQVTNGKKDYVLTGPYHLDRKYYCAKKDCLVKRHPYFWKGLLDIPTGRSDLLQSGHLKYLFDELHFNADI